MTHPTAGDKYAARAARRLNALLNELDAPADKIGRGAFLAQKLKMPSHQAMQMIGGIVRWDFDLLDLACSGFDKQPGYFLDERAENLPSDTKLVTSANAGDSMVLRPPEGLVPPDLPKGRWRYGSEGLHAALFPLGSLLVYTEPEAPVFPVKPGFPYAIQGDMGIEFLRCVDVRDSMVHFSAEHPGGTSLMLPLPKARSSGALPDRSIAGPVFVTVQPVSANA